MKSFTRHTVDSLRKMKRGDSIEIWALRPKVAPIVSYFHYASPKRFSTKAEGRKTIIYRVS